jgi:hypothetical protein
MNWKLATLAFAVILCSCSTSRSVVQEGPFQKRKYVNKGWFLDLPSARKDHPKPQRTRIKDVPEAIVAIPVEPIDQHMDTERTLEPLSLALAPVVADDRSAAPAVASAPKPAGPLKSSDLAAVGYGKRASLTKRIGAAAAAVPALMAPRGDDVGGVNIFALLGFIFAFLVPIAGLVLSIIGLNQTSPGDGHGHGLALAGLIISIIALVIAVTIIL